jgi:CBS domain-containing protein
MTTTHARHTYGPASFHGLSVGDAMHRGVFTCKPEATLPTVARLLAAHRIHAVVVAPTRDGGDWSVVSDLDVAAALGDGSLLDTTAGEIATEPTPCVGPGETLRRAAQLMRDYETHHLIVVKPGSARPAGVLSALDIADVVAELREPAA